MATPIVRLNDDSFGDWAEGKAPLTLVLVRSAGCAQSMALEPVLEDLVSRYSGRVRLATLDMDESPMMVAKHKVEALPTMLLFHGGRQVSALAACRPNLATLDEFITAAEKHSVLSGA